MIAAFTTLLAHWRRAPLQLITLLGGLILATALWSAVQAINAEVATKIGIPSIVIAHLPSWRESTMFSPRERAAMSYCEALTIFDQGKFAAAHDELRTHFTERDVAEMAAVIINMNLWTRLKLAQGAVPVDSTTPRGGEVLKPETGLPS